MEPPSAGKLRTKQAKRVGRCGGKDIGNICRRAGHERNAVWGNCFPSVVLPVCRAKAPCGKEAFLLT